MRNRVPLAVKSHAKAGIFAGKSELVVTDIRRIVGHLCLIVGTGSKGSRLCKRTR